MPGKYDLYPFSAGEILVLKKKHPCGGNVWQVERVAQEVTLKCEKCSRLINVRRKTLEKSIKEIRKE